MVSELGTILGCCDLRLICCQDTAAFIRMPVPRKPSSFFRTALAEGIVLISSPGRPSRRDVLSCCPHSPWWVVSSRPDNRVVKHIYTFQGLTAL